MNAWARRGLRAAVFTGFTGGALALGAGIASASDASECCPERPVSPLSANVSTPVKICDNVVGTPTGPMGLPCVDEQFDTGELVDASPVDLPSDATEIAGDAGQAVLGNRGQVNLVAPVDVSGNAIALGSDAHTETSTDTSYHHDASVVTDGSAGPLAGNVVNGNAVAPVAVTGNAAGMFGNASTVTESSTSASSSGPVSTDGSHQIGSANVVDVPAALPMQATGNAISGAGTAHANGTHEIDAEAGGPATTGGAHSVLGGNLGSSAHAVPMQINDNALSGIGQSSSTAESTAGARAGGDLTTDGLKK